MVTHEAPPPRLSLGTAQWGMPYGVANRSGVPAAESLRAMLALAREAGVDAIDTARAYGDSERRLGEQIGSDGRWCISTKLAPDVHAEGVRCAEALARVGRSLAESRRALGRDRLDVLLLHRAAHLHACDGALWRRLRREREERRIGALGVSAASPEEAWQLLEEPGVEWIQVATSLLDQRLSRAGFFASARSRGVHVQVRSVFLQGVAHLGPALLPTPLAALAPVMRRIRRFAQERGTTCGQLFLAFARRLEADQVIVGCERPAQLRDVLRSWREAPVAEADLARLATSLPDLDARLLDPSRWARGAPAAAAPQAPARASGTGSSISQADSMAFTVSGSSC